jgi:hypothetical protein
VSVVPTAVFEYLNESEDENPLQLADFCNPPELDSFPIHIRKPKEQHLNDREKLEYSVWTCCFDSYARQKEFNSSYNTLEEANQCIEYVFWYENPWGFNKDEMYIDKDKTDSKGLHRMEVHPDNSE